MKIAIYSPYLDTLGGGERYMMTIAEAFLKDSQVDVLLDNHLFSFGANFLKAELSKRFNLNLNKANFTKAPIGKDSTLLSRSIFLRKYDLFFYLTDGSIFFPTAKKNILHIQSPIIGQPAKSKWGRLKLKGWDLIIYNSLFTREHSAKSWPIKSQVLYPPVDLDKIKPLKKKKYILSVGRFFGYLKDKKHEILIKTFIDLNKNSKIPGWTLNLAGSAAAGDEPYLRQLRKMSDGFPINFYPNLSFERLVKLYGESSIYWHASGYDETDPAKMEHFGISTVEAMGAGVVPIVIGKGGQLEIVKNGISGYIWYFPDQLKKLTQQLTSDDKLRQKISNAAIKRATSFNKEKFTNSLVDLAVSLN